MNNWDLVDVSAEQLVGAELLDSDPLPLLLELAGSASLWERRVAMIATFAFLKAGRAEPTLTIAEALLGDREDLLHKAVGWMLRELGKRVSRDELLSFLDRFAARMPRTALSYATEHLPAEVRAHYRSLPRVPA